MATKILLIGDIGGGKVHFHTGDEAMSHATISSYLKYVDASDITALSRTPFQNNHGISMYEHLDWPIENGKARLYFCILVSKCILYRVFKRDTFKPFQLAFIQTIKQNDIVHFTGGGNMTSIFSHVYYYYLFIIVAAKIFGKKVILTSQTIGPFNYIDWFFALMFINSTHVIGLREPKRRSYISMGIIKKDVVNMLDSAYFLPSSIQYVVPQKKHTIRIGLSLHKWKTHTAYDIAKILHSAFKKLVNSYDVEFVLIPHLLFVENNDTHFMQEIVNEISLPHVISKKEEELFSQGEYPECKIKKLTGSVDVLFTSRYHGIVFALSQNIPVLSLEYGPYYERKNSAALSLVYGSKTEKYIANLHSSSVGNDIYDKSCYLIKNNQQEKNMLKKLNKNVLKKTPSIETLITTLLEK